MVSISLCMIVRNEEKVLERCLDSVCRAVDEMIIVDTGSVDSTKEIAGKYTDKVYDFVWVDDFSAARNFSFSKAAPQIRPKAVPKYTGTSTSFASCNARSRHPRKEKALPSRASSGQLERRS